VEDNEIEEVLASNASPLAKAREITVIAPMRRERLAGFGNDLMK
jgi:hypothetical protein